MNEKTKKLILAALFLVLGMVLPLATMQLKEIGDTLLPMHLPILLCGLICGWKFGLATGLMLPFLRSLIFGMPPIYPNAVWMAAELAAYGLVAGLLYGRKKHSLGWLYASLITAQLAGRVVWGIVKALLLGLNGKPFTMEAFWVGGFLDAALGIVLQLILVPTIVSIYNKYFNREKCDMKTVVFPYGKEKISYDFKEQELVGVLTSSIEEYVPKAGQHELVKQALANPVGSPKLSELAAGKKKVVIIASDHTRPVPSKYIIPHMLEEIRKGSPDAEITILIATGCHRGTTKEELVGKFGEDIVANENIYIHNCDEKEKLVNIGTLPSGGQCEINSIAYEADLLVSEGFIEPHFFAGFSGGRKSVLPGIAGRTTVLANHCSEFIDSPRARTGILEDNPIHKDMLWAAETAKLCFIVNVVLNAEKEVIYATAGDLKQAHKAGTDFLSGLCGAKAVDADIVVTTNGGYPLDQNIYQAVKGMTAAEATVKKGGVIVMMAASNDGTGGDHFYHQLADEADLRKTMDTFLARSRNETASDQWQSQILVRILMHARVIYISQMPDEMIESMHMTPAHSLEEALQMAKQMLGKDDVKIAAIPDGVSVIVKK